MNLVIITRKIVFSQITIEYWRKWFKHTSRMKSFVKKLKRKHFFKVKIQKLRLCYKGKRNCLYPTFFLSRYRAQRDCAIRPRYGLWLIARSAIRELWNYACRAKRYITLNKFFRDRQNYKNDWHNSFIFAFAFVWYQGKFRAFGTAQFYSLLTTKIIPYVAK